MKIISQTAAVLGRGMVVLLAGDRLLFAPLLQGVIVKTKALFAGRVGAPLLQPYHDLARLLLKESVFSRTTTWVFLAGPVAGVAVPEAERRSARSGSSR